MRRWIIMAAALLVLMLLPSHGTELGQLKPVAVLYLAREQDSLTVETDTGDSGSGATLQDALEDLQETTSGHIFLDTVENLILTDDTCQLLPDMQRLLRPSVRVCVADSEIDMETVEPYLEVHRSNVTLREANIGASLPKLIWMEERYRFEE